MLVSCIIPTFNRAHVLERAVQSVLNQTYCDLECIVVDDASTDETHALLEKIYDPRLKLIRLEKNRGVSAARNCGAREARGQWLAFLDSDDEWLAHKLEEQVKLALDPHEHPLIHSNEIWVRNGVRVNAKSIYEKGGGDQFARSCQSCVIGPSTVMIKASVFWELDGFREDFEVCEDYEFWLRYLASREVSFISEPLIVKYGGHDDQLSRRYKAMDDWRLRALLELLEHKCLSFAQQQVVFAEIQRKGRILLIGYEKHQRPRDCQRVQAMIDKAQTLLINS
jgi:glycosyltransferase involved in cell wall biosynthesis